MHQDEGRAGDRPCRLARFVGQDLVVGLAPVGACCCCLEAVVTRLNHCARGVLHVQVGHLVLLGVGVLDVADGAVQALHESGHAFVTLAASATARPVDRGALANRALPVRADLGQVVGEDEGGARTVGAAHRQDVLARQLGVRVQCLDGGIVPLLDLAQVDVRQQFAGDGQFARLDALQVDHRHHAADHRGELHQALLGQLFVLQGRVGGAEVDGLGANLLDAAGRADGLIVDLVTRCFLVCIGPFGIHGRRERCASTGNFRRERSARYHQRHDACNGSLDQLHMSSRDMVGE